MKIGRSNPKPGAEPVGVHGVQEPPVWGTPTLHKEGQTSRACAS